MAIKLADTARPNNYVDQEHLGTYPVAYAEDIWFSDGTRLSEKKFTENTVSISDITKTSTNGLVDTYTIRLTNGTTATFDVTNGETGAKGDKGDTGAKGIKGDTGAKGDKGDAGADGVGIVDIAKTNTSGLVDTYTITLSNGATKTFTVTNGSGGSSGDTDLITKDEVLNYLLGGND